MSKARKGDHSFQSSGAGKGDSDRTTDTEAFRRGYEAIDWGRRHEKQSKQFAERFEACCGCTVDEICSSCNPEAYFQ